MVLVYQDNRNRGENVPHHYVNQLGDVSVRERLEDLYLTL